MPCISPELAALSHVLNNRYCVFDLMIPFSSSGGTGSSSSSVGVIIWTISTDEQGLRAALPLGDCVSTELFPSESA